MADPRLDEWEYLQREMLVPDKHEYVDGALFTLPGEPFEHHAIAAALLGELGNALKGRAGRVLSSAMKVYVPAPPCYLYADATAVRGPCEVAGPEREVLLNPTVVVEVFSDATEARDRGQKFALYRRVPSVEQVVLASARAPQVEVFTRQPDGAWRLDVGGPGQTADLASIGCALAVDAIYAGVFDPGA